MSSQHHLYLRMLQDSRSNTADNAEKRMLHPLNSACTAVIRLMMRSLHTAGPLPVMFLPPLQTLLLFPGKDQRERILIFALPDYEEV